MQPALISDTSGWYMFVANTTSLVQVQFGNSLLNTPTGANLYPNAPGVTRPCSRRPGDHARECVVRTGRRSPNLGRQPDLAERPHSGASLGLMVALANAE